LSISATVSRAYISVKHCLGMMPTDSESTLNIKVEQSTGLTPAHDPVRPDYYVRDGIECYQVQKASMGIIKYQGYLEGCAQKYLWRWEQKNGKQDLEKAVEYLGKLLETLD
jgi:hypothetical protein